MIKNLYIIKQYIEKQKQAKNIIRTKTKMNVVMMSI